MGFMNSYSVADYYDHFGVLFNMHKIKYVNYAENLKSMNFITPNVDEVNLFISLETVFNFCSAMQDLENRIISLKTFDNMMVSNIINFAGHYRRFFKNDYPASSVFLYMTDLDSTEFNEMEYNEDYRSYYLTKYNENPAFVLFTERLKQVILPQVRTICDFIPNLYFISAKNIEGSLVPLVLSKIRPQRKNLILSGSKYDIQFMVMDNFRAHYINRGNGHDSQYYTIDSYIRKLNRIKNDFEPVPEAIFFKNYNFFTALLACNKDIPRSIPNISGVGVKKLKEKLQQAINLQAIKTDTSNPELLSRVFIDKEEADQFVANYNCVNLLHMYDALSESQTASITNQIVDRLDMDSLISLNNTKYYETPIYLENFF